MGVSNNGVEYEIINDEYLFHLTRRVNKMCRIGWIPQGCVTVTIDRGNNKHFYQAMVRPNEVSDGRMAQKHTPARDAV